MKTSELIGNDLDYWAGKAYGKTNLCLKNGKLREISSSSILNPSKWHPSINWVQGGPILHLNNIATEPGTYEWTARWDHPSNHRITFWYKGTTPLIAAMRAFVASVYGEEVDETKL